MSKSDVSIIKKLIQEKHFICFKDQNLDEKKLSNFAKNFDRSKFILKKIKLKNLSKFSMCLMFLLTELN